MQSDQILSINHCADSFQDSYLLSLLLPAAAPFHLLNLRQENKERNYNALPNGFLQLRKAALPFFFFFFSFFLSFYFNKFKVHSHVLVKLHLSPDTTGGTVTKVVALTIQGSPLSLGSVAMCGRPLLQHMATYVPEKHPAPLSAHRDTECWSHKVQIRRS